MIRSLISAELRFHQAYILQKMHPLEVRGLSSASASLSFFKENSYPPKTPPPRPPRHPLPPKEIRIVMYDSKKDIKVKYILILLSLGTIC